MKLLVDNDLPPTLAHSLAPTASNQGHFVIHMRDKFGTGNIKDPDWLRVLAKERNWSLLSEDYHILRRPDELQGMLEASLVCFFLRSAWSKGLDEFTRLGKLISRFPEIVQAYETGKRPAAYWVPIKGRISRIALPR